MADTVSINKLVTRDQFETYIEIDGENQLIGDGFTTLKESKNPKEYTRKYINMKTEVTDVIGYAPSIEYTLDVYSESAVVDDFVTIADEELIGDDAVRTITNVNKWKTDTDGNYVAFQRKYAVIPSDKGDGTDAMIYSGTMKATTDIVKGTFNASTKTFTADA